MATIKDPTIIKTMLENGGVYEDDPAVARIYLYAHVDHPDTPHFAIFYNYRDDDLGGPFARSPFVAGFLKLFDNGTPTIEGQWWLKRYASQGESTEKSL